MTTLEKISKTAADNFLFSNAKGVVVALSGGSDSMTLLSWFLKTRPCPFCAAHVNHCLRPEADGEQLFVENFCKKNGVKLYTKKIDISALCPKGLSLETFAREQRYAFFNEVLTITGFSHVATAHNLDDNIETLFMNIIRGSGVSGLCAIPYKRGAVVRPLIEVSKCEIYDYCRENELPFVTDKTNFESICTRNILRNEILPLIKKINPSIEKTPLIALAKDDSEYLSTQATALYNAAKTDKGLSIPALKGYARALLSRVLRMAMLDFCGFEPDFFHTDSLIRLVNEGTTSDKTELSGGWFAKISYDRLLFEKKGEKPFLITPTEVFCGKNEIEGLGTVTVVCEKTGKMILRSRCEGDEIVFNGKTKSLKKLFIDKKIPASQRGRIFILEEDGKIVYVHGFYSEKGLSVSLEKSNI